MSFIGGLLARLRTEFGRRAMEARMDEEFRFHLEMETAKAIAQGVAPKEAQRRARAAFGGVERHREAMRDGRHARWLEDVWADVRYSVRTLRRSPAFTLAAAVTLGLGIGLNGVVFGQVNGLLLRPLPATDPEQLVGIYSVDRRSGRAEALSYDDLVDFRDRSGAFADVAGLMGIPLNVEAGETADMFWGNMVTENFFTVLAMRPVVGRFFTAADAASGANPYAVLSYRAWRLRFGGDQNVVGRAVRINGSPFTIVGVAPAGFNGMRKFGYWPELWVPAGMSRVLMPGSSPTLRGRDGRWEATFARMHRGWSRQRTQGAASILATQLAQAFPASNRNVDVLLVPARTGFDNPTFVQPRVVTLASGLALFAVTLVLLIVCANLANLLLSHAAARERELAIRLSLGCSRGRLLRQLLVEAAVLAIPGAVGGVALVFAGPALEARMVPQLQFRVGFGSEPDYLVVLYTAAIAVLAILLFGIAPALRASRQAVVSSMKAVIGERDAGRPGARIGIRAVLVVAQLALSVILLTAGMLFVRSLVATRAVDPGFDARNRVAVSVNPGLQGYDEARGRAFYREVLARVRTLPGVESASWGFPVPFDTYGREISLYVEGASQSSERQTISVPASVVDAGFFDALGLRLIAGRDFADGDSSGVARRIVVSRAMAARLWPGRDALGQRARLFSQDGPEITVVGVVADARFTSLGELPAPHAYLPLGQNYRGWQTLIVHGRGEREGMIANIRRAVGAVDPALPTFGAMTLQQGVDNALYAVETAASFAGVFGLVALLIASIGLYAIVANVVAARTREIAVRMALGASPGSLLRLVMGRVGQLGALGLALGIVGAAIVARLLRGLLFGLSPHDPATFVLVPVMLGAVVLAASYLPARRAAKLDPVAAMRE